MSGWAVLILLALSIGAGVLLAARSGRGAAGWLALALLAAATGYAWQGRPVLPGAPAQTHGARARGEDLFMAERPRWLERVGYDAQALDTADALIRNGDADYAVGILRGAIARAPNDPLLWLALGHALARYADGAVTPAARFAYDRAAILWPGHPAPHYFLGLSYADAGDLAQAQAVWADLLARAPADARWRGRVAFMLELMRGMSGEEATRTNQVRVP